MTLNMSEQLSKLDTYMAKIRKEEILKNIDGYAITYDDSLQTDYELEESFGELIDYEPFKIGDLEYFPSRTWHDFDPIAYDMALSEYIDSSRQETEDDQKNERE